MFTDREIKVVRDTWEMASTDPDAAASLFYGKLFEAAPDVKPLFTADMTDQGRKLMQMIGIAVNNMDRIEQIVPALIELGERHDDYGAQDAHYPVVGEVLIDTLRAALGDACFTEEAEQAWARTYSAVASVMLSR